MAAAPSPTARTLRVLSVIARERVAQDAKWGPQAHPLEAWLAILSEEVGELAKEILGLLFGAPAEARGNLREEAIQVAAVAAAIVEFIDNGVAGARDDDRVDDTLDLAIRAAAAEIVGERAGGLPGRVDAVERILRRHLASCTEQVAMLPLARVRAHEVVVGASPIDGSTQAKCSCSWRGDVRDALGASLADAVEHTEATGHALAEFVEQAAGLTAP